MERKRFAVMGHKIRHCCWVRLMILRLGCVQNALLVMASEGADEGPLGHFHALVLCSGLLVMGSEDQE